MYGNGANKSWLEMSDQERISAMYPQPSREHQIERMIEDTIFWTVVLYVLGWLIKRMFYHPLAALIFIASVVGLYQAGEHSITWLSWISLITGFLALGRVVR